MTHLARFHHLSTAADRVVAACADVCGVTPSAIMGHDRHKSIAMARHVAMFLMRREGMSYPEIGRFCGHKDHTSAIWAVRKVEGLLATRIDVWERVELAKRLLAGVVKVSTVDAEGIRVAG